MDKFYDLASLLSTIVFIIIPTSLIGLIYFLLYKKTSKRFVIIVTLILTSLFSYYLFTDLYPRSSFYRSNLKENTELTLPTSARLIAHLGTNSIYNFGDYNISYMYEFNEADYDKLYLQLVDKGFQQSDNYLETNENEKVLSMTSNLKKEKILTKDYGFKNFEVLFLNDNKTIVFNSNKW